MKQSGYLLGIVRVVSFFSETRLALLLGLLWFGLGDVIRAFGGDPAAALAKARVAAGGEAWDSVRTSHAGLQLETGGLKGVAEEPRIVPRRTGTT